MDLERGLSDHGRLGETDEDSNKRMNQRRSSKEVSFDDSANFSNADVPSRIVVKNKEGSFTEQSNLTWNTTSSRTLPRNTSIRQWQNSSVTSLTADDGWSCQQCTYRNSAGSGQICAICGWDHGPPDISSVPEGGATSLMNGETSTREGDFVSPIREYSQTTKKSSSSGATSGADTEVISNRTLTKFGPSTRASGAFKVVPENDGNDNSIDPEMNPANNNWTSSAESTSTSNGSSHLSAPAAAALAGASGAGAASASSAAGGDATNTTATTATTERSKRVFKCIPNSVALWLLLLIVVVAAVATILGVALKDNSSNTRESSGSSNTSSTRPPMAPTMVPTVPNDAIPSTSSPSPTTFDPTTISPSASPSQPGSVRPPLDERTVSPSTMAPTTTAQTIEPSPVYTTTLVPSASESPTTTSTATPSPSFSSTSSVRPTISPTTMGTGTIEPTSAPSPELPPPGAPGIPLTLEPTVEGGSDTISPTPPPTIGSLPITFEQLGTAGITSGALGKSFGEPIVVSENGRTIAISASLARNQDVNNERTGAVQVYRLSEENQWVQLGSTLQGEAIKGRYGRSIALSHNGLTLAIGAPSFDDPEGDVKVGQVFVYKYDSGTSEWVQHGPTITGSAKGGRLGAASSLSITGKWLAIGNAAGVEVYEYKRKNDEWALQGSFTEGGYNKEGWKLSLSLTGNAIAVGSPAQSTIPQVAVYDYDSTNNTWVPRSVVEFDSSLGGGDPSMAPSVLLSDDGVILSIRPAGTGNIPVQVVSYDGSTTGWSPMGDPIDGAFSAPALSSDGKLICTSSSLAEPNLYEYDTEANSWTKLISQEPTITGDNITMSGDGNVIALAGDATNGGGSREVNIYRLVLVKTNIFS